MQALVRFMLVVATFGMACDCLRSHDHKTQQSAMCKDEGHFTKDPPAFVYLITSHEPVFIADILPDDSIALLAFPDPLADGMLCPCCIWNMAGETQQEFFGAANQSSLSHFPLASGSDWRRRIRLFMRTRLWSIAQPVYAPLDMGSFGVQYFVLIDFEALPHSFELLRDQFTLFQQQLMQQQPYAAVPFHPCNTVDSADTGNDAVITSVYSTHFVAVHKSASKLLLPLDEELFSLVCHIMLRGTVMQFQFGNRALADSSACQLADDINQHAMMHLVSSLLEKEFLFALPFSPRIQSPRRPPYFMLSSSGEYSTALSEESCPVLCSFYYWAIHPTFACCESANAGQTKSRGSADYNADIAYARIAQRWQLPRNHDLACERLTSENYATFATTEIGKDLTHPLPKFRLALSTPPITLDEQWSCAPDDSALPSAASGTLSRFKLTLQPSQLQLQPTGHEGTSTLRVSLQLVLSAPDSSHSSQFKAVFGSVEAIHVRTQCNGIQTVAVIDVRHLRMISETDHPRQSALAPWFYLPSENGQFRQWFEVNSNVSKDSLRILIADVSVLTHCDDVMFVSANASVLLREMASAGFPCSCHVFSAETHNVSFSAQEVAMRASVLVEDPPSDLFDDGDEAATDGIHSDFACAGPNRGWSWGEQKETALPKGSMTKMSDIVIFQSEELTFFAEMEQGHYNMCLFQNICWIDGSLTLFLPRSFLFLDQAIPDFFEFESNSILRLNLAPFSMVDSTRTRW